MKSDDPIRIKSNELPKTLDLIGPNGETIEYVLIPKKGNIGVSLNKVIGPFRKFITRNK